MFQTINYLLHEKNKKGLDPELISNFNPFITRKAFSFYNSGTYVNYINDTLNTYDNLFETVEENFKFYDNLIPILPRRKHEYISKGKKKETKKEEEKQIPEFYSKRELKILGLIP